MEAPPDPEAVWASVRDLEEAAALAEELATLPGDSERAARVLKLPCLAHLHLPPWPQQTATEAGAEAEAEDDGSSDANADGDVDTRAQSLPELFHGPHADIPGTSRAVLVRRNSERGLHLVAAEDIPTGSVLLVEEAFAWSLTAEVLPDHCTHCIRPLRGPCLPCPTCHQAVFCSKACRRRARTSYHGWECRLGLRSCLASPLLGCAAVLALRTVFAEDAAPPHLYSVRRVREQLGHAHSRPAADLLKRTVAAALVARCLLPDADAGDDAVAALAGRLLTSLQACSCNAYQLSEQLLASPLDKKGEAVELGGAVYPAVSLLNHACWPNVSRHSVGRACVVRASRPVARGSELLDNYGPCFLTESRDERCRLLHTQYFFTCACRPCREDWPLLQQLPATRYKCFQCKKPVGSDLTAVRRCPHCKKKVDNKKTVRRLDEFSRSYREAITKLLEGQFETSIQLCCKYMVFLDSIVVHPSLEFLKCQQVLNQCWSLTGNTNIKQHNIS